MSSPRSDGVEHLAPFSEGNMPMSHHSTKTPLPSGLLAAALVCLAASAPAFAQDAPKEIILKLNQADIAVLGKALDALRFADAAATKVKIYGQIDDRAQHKIRIGPICATK